MKDQFQCFYFQFKFHFLVNRTNTQSGYSKHSIGKNGLLKFTAPGNADQHGDHDGAENLDLIALVMDLLGRN